jgi:uncharacterized protein YkwD
MRRALIALLTPILAMTLVGVGDAAPAKHVRHYDKVFLTYVNQARKADGLKPYKESARLYKLAHHWAAHMAHTRNLEHNAATLSLKSFRSASACTKATTIGENVGEQGSTSAKQLFDLYMSDPAHRDNNLSPKYNAPHVAAYTDVGIATVEASDGSEWNVMDFANHCD